jgi:hypothetical protein
MFMLPLLLLLQDAVGNIVIRRPGSGGGEAAPPVIVQGGCMGAAAWHCAAVCVYACPRGVSQGQPGSSA